MSTFTKRLKEARTRIDLSQKQLGIQAGLDPSVASPRMNQYEKGTHLPDINTVSKICAVLGVPVAYLYCEDDGLAELVAVYEKLPDQIKEEIKKLIIED
jgi:transcriptional regulator with XRE-family HTH domain